jgi:Flp pilus assembly protein TadG
MRGCLARLRRCESGTAAIEFAFVGLIAISLFLGVIEFGRGLYMKNEMSYAADRAARKILTNAAVTDDEVETVMRDAITFGVSANLQITFGTETVDGISFRSLLIRYPVTLLIPGLRNGSFMLTVDRRVPLS